MYQEFLMELFGMSVSSCMRKDFLSVTDTMTFSEARKKLSEVSEWSGRSPSGRALYLYVVSETGKYLGVLPVYQNGGLTTAIDTSLVSSAVLTSTVTLSEDYLVQFALEQLVLYCLRALPVVNSDGLLVGVIDYEVLGVKSGSIGEHEVRMKLSASAGFDIEAEKRAGVFVSSGLRMKWLVVTMISGLLCSMILELNHNLREIKAVVLVFLPLLLMLGDAVCHQSCFLSTSEHLGSKGSSMLRLLSKDFLVCFVIGLVSSLVVGTFSGVMSGRLIIAVSLGISALFSVMSGGLIGILVPACIRKFKGDPDHSSGPISLGLCDTVTATITMIVIFLLCN